MSRNPTRDFYLSIAREARLDADAVQDRPALRDALSGILVPWLLACTAITIGSLAYLISEVL